MILWLVGSLSDHPWLAAGVPPPGLLSYEEAGRFACLPAPKRRRDWLLGRWTAKHLLQAAIWESTGQRVRLDTIEIVNDADGSPYALFGMGAWPLSISHSGSLAFCAMIQAARSGRAAAELRCAGNRCTAPVALGADVERVEPRPWGFVTDYFTETEIEQVRTAAPDQRDILVTALWSAKESVLKALRLGLTVDTRSVSCAFLGAAQGDPALARDRRTTAGNWQPFAVLCAPVEGSQVQSRHEASCTEEGRPAFRPSPVSASRPQPDAHCARRWTGWWRTIDHSVLTLAVVE